MKGYDGKCSHNQSFYLTFIMKCYNYDNDISAYIQCRWHTEAHLRTEWNAAVKQSFPSVRSATGVINCVGGEKVLCVSLASWLECGPLQEWWAPRLLHTQRTMTVFLRPPQLIACVNCRHWSGQKQTKEPFQLGGKCSMEETEECCCLKREFRFLHSVGLIS